MLLRLLKSAPKPQFLAISNPIETAVLGSLLTVSVFLVFETTGNNAALMSRPNSRQQ